MNRRDKLLLLWACIATALLLVGGIVLFQIIQPRLASTARLGGTQEFPIGSHTLFECDRAAGRCQLIGDTNSLVTDARFPIHPSTDYEVIWVWVTHDAADSWRGLIAVSTHRGCFVNWNQDKNQFVEGCYGSKWDSEGKYHNGPAPRGLDSYPVRVENGNVLIDFQLVRGDSHG